MPAPKKKKTKNPASLRKQSMEIQADRQLSMMEIFKKGSEVNDKKAYDVIVGAMEALQGDGIDHAIRLRAASVYLDRTVGLPTRKEEVTHRTVTTEDEMDAKLIASPYLRKQIQKKLDDIEKVVDI
jgi:hypothetical protein